MWWHFVDNTPTKPYPQWYLDRVFEKTKLTESSFSKIEVKFSEEAERELERGNIEPLIKYFQSENCSLPLDLRLTLVTMFEQSDFCSDYIFKLSRHPNSSKKGQAFHEKAERQEFAWKVIDFLIEKGVRRKNGFENAIQDAIQEFGKTRSVITMIYSQFLNKFPVELSDDDFNLPMDQRAKAKAITKILKQLPD